MCIRDSPKTKYEYEKKFVYLKSGSAKSPKTKYEYGGGTIKKNNHNLEAMLHGGALKKAIPARTIDTLTAGN